MDNLDNGLGISSNVQGKEDKKIRKENEGWGGGNDDRCIDDGGGGDGDDGSVFRIEDRLWWIYVLMEVN